ncbi:MAG: ATP-binding protein [Sideroxyarcus sp.]|nr:ATP-binding protein [Sideroxyarcus sp.]
MSNRPSSSGERAAIIGYSAQYRIAAEIIYSALVAEELEWIALADPDVGRLDDIQVATPGRLDAYQVKWGEQTGTLSFNDLTSGKGDTTLALSKGLIGQLAGGWHKFKQAHPTRRVAVHLVARDIASTNAPIPHDDNTISKANLQGFLTDCWADRSWSTQGLDACPTGWSPALTELKDASGIGEAAFLSFIRDCELEFGYSLQSASTTRDGLRQAEDIKTLTAFLFRTVGADKRVIRIERDELLKRLGWAERFSQRFTHDFKIDKLYQPISATINDLEHALSKHKRGYVALLGTPGSGKSTTLTHTLRYRSGYRVVRYYAYVPDSFLQGRGEAASFMQDMVLALKSRGFHGGRSQAKTAKELLDKFSQQLVELHDTWLSDGVLTLILVDGLDHIEREQKTIRSLLEVLPHPDTIPEGVLFILGSQTLELKDLPSAVKAQFQTDSTRVLNMRPLARSQVFNMIDEAKLSTPLTPEQKEQAYRISDGHPLATSYLIRILAEASEASAIDAILDNANPYQGHVDQGYDTYWQSIQQNTSLRELLALLARLRIPFNPLELVRWSDEATARSLVREAGFYFHKDTPHRWRFFHNSFRQFILNRTSLNLLDERDVTLDRAYHCRLADLASQSLADTPQGWETLYHLVCAEEWESALKLATQDYYRRQFYALRPLADIKEDISFALRAARAKQDGIAIFRYLLVEHELGEREQVLDQMDMPELILALYGTEAVLNYLMDGSNLRVTNEVGLKFCRRLVATGEIKAARLIFEAAEPLELLGGAQPVKRLGPDWKLLKHWVRCAYHFRSFEELGTAISALRMEAPQHASDEDEDDATINLRVHMRQVLVSAVSEFADTDKWASMRTLSIEPDEQEALCQQLDFNICNLHPSHPEAQAALDRILLWATKDTLDDLDRVLIAEYLLTIRGDAEGASHWVEGLLQPSNCDLLSSEWKRLEPFTLRIRLNRLLASLGHAVDPVKAVPDSDGPRKHGNVLFERQLVLIASIWGRAKKGEIMAPDEIIRALHPALRLFNRGHRETQDWSAWYQFANAAEDYFNLMIRSVAAHGRDAVRELSREFEQQWTQGKTAKYWSTNRRRAIALTLYRNGDDRDIFIRRLEGLEQEIGVWHDVHGRAEEYGQLALAWREAGEVERGKSLVPLLLKGSFGIYHHKDRQLQQWVDLLTKSAAYQPDLVSEDIGRFSSALVVLEQAGRGRGTQDAATELLALAMSANPGYAKSLFDWLLEHGGLHFSSAVSGLLLGALRHESPPLESIFVVARHLLIPFDSYVYEPLAEQLAARTAQCAKPEIAQRLMSELTRTIQVKAYPGERPRLWRALIAGVREAGQDSRIFEQLLAENPGKQDSSSPSILLKDGRKLTEEDVLVLVNSFEQLVALIESIEKTEYFPWRRVIKPLIRQFSAQQINRLLSLLEPHGLDSMVRNMCASRLHELGLTKEALHILEAVLSETTASGWDISWDGGSRQQAIKALIAIAPEKWRPRALETLVDDYISEFHYPYNLIHNIEELAEILFEVVPWERLWPEIREHIYQLADFSLAEEQAPAPHESGVIAEEVLLQAVMWAANLPIDEVRDQVHCALCDFVFRGIAPVATKAVISAQLSGEQPKAIQGLAVLDTTWQLGSQLAQEYANQILSFLSVPDFILRCMATELAEEIGLSIETDQNNEKPLPMIYNLHLPPLGNDERAVPFGAIRSDESSPDSDDVLEMVRPFDPDLKMLSRASEVPFENLLHRTAALMRELVPEEQWNKSAAEKCLKLLKAIELQFPYNRLKPQVALRAISRVVAELVDADRIGIDAQMFAYSRLYRYDWRLAGKEPVTRPSAVATLKSLGLFPKKDEWIEGRTAAFEAFATRLDTGYWVVGELSQFKAWDWSVPTEYRFSMACHPEWQHTNELRGAFDFFPYESIWNASDYPDLYGVSKFPALVVYGHSRQVAIGGAEWLAFNPAFAMSLGWSLSKESLFRWVDTAGKTMAESVWWQDGPMDRQPPRSDEATGEGWLVVVSPEAQLSILQHYSPIICMRAVKRCFKDDVESFNDFSIDTLAWPN